MRIKIGKISSSVSKTPSLDMMSLRTMKSVKIDDIGGRTEG
jgi:hypothetical protein